MKPAFAILLVFALIGFETHAFAARLVSGVSDREIAIDPAFAGENLTLYGNIERDPGSDETLIGPFDAIVVVRGPSNDRVVRKKTREFGIWINTSAVVYHNFPSFFWTLSNRDLDQITTVETLELVGIIPERRSADALTSGSGNRGEFSPKLIELMRASGNMGTNTRAVSFQSDTLYSARINLPADIPNGNYLAETYIFDDGEIIARKAERFSVRTIGFERFLATSARQNPAIYGLTCIALALATGWLGGVLFKR